MRSKRRIAMRGILAAAGVMAAVGTGLYGAIGGSLWSERDRVDPPVGEEIKAFEVAKADRPAPLTPILALDGKTLDLSRFQGKVVLLNFWATWCAPCVAELPSLYRLQAQFSPDVFSVVALSIDRGGAQQVKPFLERHGLENLNVYLDPESEALRVFAAKGLPMTYLLDRQGRLIGSLTGPAEWDSEAAVALIAHYLETA